MNPPGVRSPVPVASGRSELKGSSKFHRQMSQSAKCLDVPQICWNGNCSGSLTRGAETWVLAFLLALQTSGWGQAARIDLHLNRFFFKASWDPHKCWTRERCHVDWEYSCPSSCSSSPLASEQTLQPSSFCLDPGACPLAVSLRFISSYPVPAGFSQT